MANFRSQLPMEMEVSDLKIQNVKTDYELISIISE